MSAAIQDQVSGERVLALLLRAVEQYSPSNSEGPVVRVFAEALRAAGIPYRRQPVPGVAEDETRANLIVHLGPDELGLHLVGHLDTIDLGFDAELGIRRDGEHLYGLGTADMKSGCAAMVEALVAAVSSGVRLRRGVQLSLVVGEEEYGDGAEAVVADGVEAPLTVVGEPTSLSPCTGHSGYLEYRLSGFGARAHAALPEKGANAIHATLAWMTGALRRIDALPPAYAVSLREIRGGTSLFVIPDACEVLIDVHLPVGAPVEAVDRAIEESRAAADAAHPGCRLEAERQVVAEGFEVGEGDARVRPLMQAFEDVGLTWSPAVFRSHSDANLLHATGSATVVCGPGALEVAHTDEEHVSIPEVQRAARLYAALIERACG